MYRQQQESAGEKTIKGRLENFIDSEELNWRKPTKLEYGGTFQPVAQFTRNKQFTPANLRSPETLAKCIDYLLETVLTIIKAQPAKTLEVLGFIEDRMRAIRCEYHVQNIIDIGSYIKMIKFHLLKASYTRDPGELKTTVDIIWLTINSNDSQNNKCSKGMKIQDRLLIVQVALLLSVQRHDFHKVLSELSDEDIAESQEVLGVCSAIQNRHFTMYFRQLAKQKFQISCGLYLYVKEMRETAIRSFAKAQMNYSFGSLKNILGFNSCSQVAEYLRDLGYDSAQLEKVLKSSEEESANKYISLKMSLAQQRQVNRGFSYPDFMRKKTDIFDHK